MEAKPNAIKQTVNIGSFEVSTLLAGTRTAPDPQTIFGMNVTPEEFATVSAENFIPVDKNQFFFTPTVVVTGQKEFDAWVKMDAEGFNTKVKPLAEKMTFIGDGDAVVSGVTGMAAHGHTPGHMTYMLESDGEQLVLIADTANHYVWSLAYPDWEVKFDMDKAAAAATRKNVFGMLAADKIPFIGYHMPFPGMAFVAPRGEGGFHYVPVSYQMLLG